MGPIQQVAETGSLDDSGVGESTMPLLPPDIPTSKKFAGEESPLESTHKCLSKLKSKVMDSKVKVCADKAGNVIVKSTNNPEYGHIRVEQERMVVEDNGFARKKKLSALIPGRIVDLAGFGWTEGQEVDGKIVVKESLKAFNPKDPERDFKMAGKSGVVCTVDGEPIHRKHFYTLSGTQDDVLVSHDNGEEIQAAYAELGEEVESSEENKEFNL